MESIDTFKSINEFAEIVGVPARTIRCMVKEGKLPSLPRGEKHVLIPLKAGAEKLVEISKTAMNERHEMISSSLPITHVVAVPTYSKTRKGRMPDSIRLGRAAR